MLRSTPRKRRPAKSFRRSQQPRHVHSAVLDHGVPATVGVHAETAQPQLKLDRMKAAHGESTPSSLALTPPLQKNAKGSSCQAAPKHRTPGRLGRAGTLSWPPAHWGCPPDQRSAACERLFGQILGSGHKDDGAIKNALMIEVKGPCSLFDFHAQPDSLTLSKSCTLPPWPCRTGRPALLAALAARA